MVDTDDALGPTLFVNHLDVSMMDCEEPVIRLVFVLDIKAHRAVYVLQSRFVPPATEPNEELGDGI
jgi:hypothetical protein